MAENLYEQPKCMKCGKTLTNDEIGIHKKMINRGATEFFCLRCLAEFTHSTEDRLRERIEHFRAQGCLLFQ
ncbi:MAG: hypothetical protein II889_12965 [Clostridia bacterium]|nr:hypothetical protein [Clostridia bacterium]MBQ3708796.1 hypothetical protein [Clostridia bacterium]MCR4905716.1 hypothetical protein [Clostridiales bacterium]